jgi:cobalamin biosynthesis protein CbiD
VNVNQARKLLIVTLNHAGLTDEAIRSMSEEDWAALSGKAQQLASQCKSAMDKMGLKDYHVGVELVDSVGGKDYLKIVDGNVDYNVWGQIAGERAAAAAKAAAEALTQEETAAAPAVSTGFGPGAGLTPADGKPSERVTTAGAETPAAETEAPAEQ